MLGLGGKLLWIAALQASATPPVTLPYVALETDDDASAIVTLSPPPPPATPAPATAASPLTATPLAPQRTVKTSVTPSSAAPFSAVLTAATPPPAAPVPAVLTTATPPPAVLTAASQTGSPPSSAATAIAVAGLMLPSPVADPMNIDFRSDPVLRLGEEAGSPAEFRRVVAEAVARNPERAEAEAGGAEARAALAEARERLYPSADLTVSAFKTLSRDFSNDPENIVERSRSRQRTDVQVSVNQTLLDFGATSKRIAAAGARLRGAAAALESTADQVALRAIASWEDVFANRALVDLAEGSVELQVKLREAVEERIRGGVSAEGDLAQVDSYIASSQTRLAQLRRSLANAEARYTQVIGLPPPETARRAPKPDAPAMSKDAAMFAAGASPKVRAAEAYAEGAARDYRAQKSDGLPNVTAGIDAGRYGVFENDRDYDVRARLTLRQRFFGGVGPRIDQASARARAAQARSDRVREEASRDAAIAWSDVQALEAQLVALRQSYIASRRSRDVLVERFRVSRGSLLDVLSANDSYFDTVVAYIQALSELDAARYVLLSQTGHLLAALNITPTPAREMR